MRLRSISQAHGLAAPASPDLGQGKWLSADLGHRKLRVIELALGKVRDFHVDVVGKTDYLRARGMMRKSIDLDDALA
jgi:hypothetical protein